MPKHRTEALRRIYEVAEDQQGLFTTKQAKAAGFADNTHPYHVQAGNCIRHRSIYRLALFPATEHPDLVQWALWSRNRREETGGGVYSHETALSLWELSERESFETPT